MSKAPEPASPAESSVLMGEIAGVRGVRGELKVHSWTRPRGNLLDYPVWTLQQHESARDWRVTGGGWRGRHLVVQLQGLDNREAAEALIGASIRVARSQLPAAGADEFYWFELEGLAVENRAGVSLGRVNGLIETGANDVMRVVGDRERLIPYTPGVHIDRIDTDAGRMIVDWDPEF